MAELDGLSVAGLGGYDPNKLGYPALQKALNEVFAQIGLNPDETNRNQSPRILDCIPDAIEGAWISATYMKGLIYKNFS